MHCRKVSYVVGALFLDAQSHESCTHSQRSRSFFNLKEKLLPSFVLYIVLTQLLKVVPACHFRSCCPISHYCIQQSLCLITTDSSVKYINLHQRYSCPDIKILQQNGGFKQWRPSFPHLLMSVKDWQTWVVWTFGVLTPEMLGILDVGDWTSEVSMLWILDKGFRRLG